ncbi:hypothetical protein F5884DRAFT_905048 [Xylogone sp. PMI_703]|nr:hypothetical protein F5884DRAFT_905048 [Xylogone sp. PMI_703]
MKSTTIASCFLAVMNFSPASADLYPPDMSMCGSMFPGEVEASVGDFPVAIYLGPSQLTAARFTELEQPELIVKVEANQAWKDYTTRKVISDYSKQNNKTDVNRDLDLIEAFPPTLDQIIQAVAAKLNNFTTGSLILPLPCQSQSSLIEEIMNNNSFAGLTQHNQIFLPPIKDYGYYAGTRFLPLFRAAQLAYNLTVPGLYDYQVPNPSLWPDHPLKVLPDDDDPPFLLNIDFERTFLHLRFSSLEWMAEAPKAETTLITSGSDNIFTDSKVEPISSTEAVNVLSDIISTFIENHLTIAEQENLRAMALTGGASDEAVEAVRIALRSISHFRKVEMFIDIDPSYVPALGAANWIIQRERLIRRDLQRKEEERLRGNKEL